MKRNELFDKCVANCDPATKAEVIREVDLEKAADNHIHKVVDAAGHPGWDWETQDIVDAFKAGARWQKEQMEKEAINGEIVKTLDNSLHVSSYIFKREGFKFGDKVKIIIIKED